MNDYLDKYCYNASPVEFLKLIYNADFVVTDSFHGTIFSVNFNVPFLTLRRFKDDEYSQNSRIYSILRIIDAQDRLYENNLKDFLSCIDMSFEKINKNVADKRKESETFLKNSILKENVKVKNKKITNICTGCGACAAVCPLKCIEIVMNNKGFYEYSINREKCTNCGLCSKTCGQVLSNKKTVTDMKLYSAYTKNESVLMKSASGGIAYELSKYAIENKDIVIGCTYDYKNNKAKHIKVNSIEKISLLSGSKYIQSNTKEIFNLIDKSERALIIGTPCQIASIDNYLKLRQKRDRFILVDLICHGVPSYLLWDRFINLKKGVKEICFRDKKIGWHNKMFSINNEKVKKSYNELFYNFFNTGNVYNDACYECNYRVDTCADIRIGDFWGPKFSKNNIGVSMVITCNSKGDALVKKISDLDRIEINEEEIEDYFSVQQTVNFIKPIHYDEIIYDLKKQKYTLKEISNKYCKPYLKYGRLKVFLYKLHRILGLDKE